MVDVGLFDPICRWCGKEGTLLCDYVLGRRDEPGVDAFDLQRCDAVVCRECAECVGNTHICGKGIQDGIDTRDLCPAHKGRPIIDRPLLPLTDEQAGALRISGCLSLIPSSEEEFARIDAAAKELAAAWEALPASKRNRQVRIILGD